MFMMYRSIPMRRKGWVRGRRLGIKKPLFQKVQFVIEKAVFMAITMVRWALTVLKEES